MWEAIATILCFVTGGSLAAIIKIMVTQADHGRQLKALDPKTTNDILVTQADHARQLKTIDPRVTAHEASIHLLNARVHVLEYVETTGRHRAMDDDSEE